MLFGSCLNAALISTFLAIIDKSFLSEIISICTVSTYNAPKCNFQRPQFKNNSADGIEPLPVGLPISGKEGKFLPQLPPKISAAPKLIVLATFLLPETRLTVYWNFLVVFDLYTSDRINR